MITETAPEQAWRHERTWLLLALCVLGFNGLFEFTLQWRPFLILAGLLAGLAAGLDGAGSDQSRNRQPRGSRVAGWVGLVLGLGGAVGAILWTPPSQFAEEARWHAESAEDEGQWAEALEDYETAFRHRPDDAALLIAQTRILGGLKRYDEALARLARAEQLNPASAGINAARAHWLTAAGNQGAAIEEMNQAIAKYPSSVEHRLTRAELLLQAGRPEEARKDLLAIEQGQFPVWEYQESSYAKLRQAAGLPAVAGAAPAGQ